VKHRTDTLDIILCKCFSSVEKKTRRLVTPPKVPQKTHTVRPGAEWKNNTTLQPRLDGERPGGSVWWSHRSRRGVHGQDRVRDQGARMGRGQRRRGVLTRTMNQTANTKDARGGGMGGGVVSSCTRCLVASTTPPPSRRGHPWHRHHPHRYNNQ